MPRTGNTFAATKAERLPSKSWCEAPNTRAISFAINDDAIIANRDRPFLHLLDHQTIRRVGPGKRVDPRTLRTLDHHRIHVATRRMAWASRSPSPSCTGIEILRLPFSTFPPASLLLVGMANPA